MSGLLVTALVIRPPSLSSWPVLALTTVTVQSGQAFSYSARPPCSIQMLVAGVSGTWTTSTLAVASESAMTPSAASAWCLMKSGVR